MSDSMNVGVSSLHFTASTVASPSQRRGNLIRNEFRRIHIRCKICFRESEFDFGSSSVVLSNLFKIEPIQAQIAAMKPLVADEMFPEGVDVEDVSLLAWWDEIFIELMFLFVFLPILVRQWTVLGYCSVGERCSCWFLQWWDWLVELCFLASSKTEINKISSRFRRFVWWWRSVKLAELMEDLEQCCKSVKTFNYKIQPSQNVV